MGHRRREATPTRRRPEPPPGARPLPTTVPPSATRCLTDSTKRKWCGRRGDWEAGARQREAACRPPPCESSLQPQGPRPNCQTTKLLNHEEGWGYCISILGTCGKEACCIFLSSGCNYGGRGRANSRARARRECNCRNCESYAIFTGTAISTPSTATAVL
uniref:Uncharacterized protein n=1 Tax=Arundo donax TaxID=35708 RepID=A0A0A8ZQY0_ARUDO